MARPTGERKSFTEQLLKYWVTAPVAEAQAALAAGSIIVEARSESDAIEAGVEGTPQPRPAPARPRPSRAKGVSPTPPVNTATPLGEGVVKRGPGRPPKSGVTRPPVVETAEEYPNPAESDLVE